MLPSRDWHGGSREEYETQHFGFGSQSLTIALRGAIEENIASNIRDIEKSVMMTSLDLTEDDKTELRRSCDKLISLYCQRAKPALARIDEEIEKLLHIPDTIVLPADEEKATRVSDEEYQRLKSQVSALEKRAQRAASMEAYLKAEEEELKSVEKHCEVAQQTMQTLDNFSKKLMNKYDTVSRLEREIEETTDGSAFVKNRGDFS